jgi:hypothetical protein
MEHGMIVEGELIKIALEKCLTLFDHSSLMSSLRYALLGGLGGEGCTVSLREGFVNGFLD